MALTYFMISESCFQLKQLNQEFSLGLGLNLVCETGLRVVVDFICVIFSYLMLF